MTDEYAPFRAAVDAGARIQVWRLHETGNWSAANGQWLNIDSTPRFNYPPHLYRVHPEDAHLVQNDGRGAELGQEVGAVAYVKEGPGMNLVAWYSEDAMRSIPVGTKLYASSPAHTSEASDAAFIERLAREYSLLRGWSLDDWNNPSCWNRKEIIADMRMAYDAAMRQEGGNG